MTIIAFPTTHIAAPSADPAAVRARSLVHLWMARHRHRAMLRNDLLPQPDSVLQDAATTRAKAEAEARKPFWRA